MKVPKMQFNLRFFATDGHEVAIRSLADLAENLNLSDLWDYYKAGDLARWLLSIGESEKAGRVRELSAVQQSEKTALIDLCKTLGLEVDREVVDQFVSIEERRQNKANAVAETIESKAKTDDYLNCLQRMLDSRENYGAMRSVVAELLDKHYQRFQKDARNFKDIVLLCVAVTERIGEVKSRLMGLPLVWSLTPEYRGDQWRWYYVLKVNGNQIYEPTNVNLGKDEFVIPLFGKWIKVVPGHVQSALSYVTFCNYHGYSVVIVQ